MAYSEEDIERIFRFICSEIERGKSLISILTKNDEMPSTQTFYKWIDEDVDKSKRYARATSQRAEFMFEEILDISDKSTPENVQVDKLRVDSRKWMLAKMQPTKYGDKIDITTKDQAIIPPTIVFKKYDGD